MNRAWRYALPCYLLTLPLTAIGFVIALVFYRARDWQWHDGVLTCAAGQLADGRTRIWGRPMAQTFGWLQIYDNDLSRLYADLRVHENVHVVQAFASSLLGVLAAPVVFALAGADPLWGLALGGFFGALGFGVAYGVLFFVFWAKQGFGDWYFAYRANPLEVQAYAHQDAYLTDQSTRPWGV